MEAKEHTKSTKSPYFECYEPNPSVTRYSRGKHKGMPRSKMDCVVRALSFLWSTDWETTARRLFERAILEYDMPNSPEVWKKFLVRSSRIAAKKEVPENRAGYRWKLVREIAEESKGKSQVFICSCPNHIVAVCNGKIWDSWDSSELTVREVFEDPSA